MKLFKSLIVAAFAVFAGVAFLAGHDTASAGDRDKARIDDILKRVKTYKEWRQVHKPPPDENSDVLTFTNFAALG